jgi:hypothetical protein
VNQSSATQLEESESGGRGHKVPGGQQDGETIGGADVALGDRSPQVARNYMKLIVRAGGIAAAAFAFVAAASYSDPSLASEGRGIGTGSSYLEHAAATIDAPTPAESDPAVPA